MRDCALHIRLDSYDRLISWIEAADGQLNTEEGKKAKKAADYYIESFKKLGWDGLKFSNIYRMPGYNNSNRNQKGGPFYVVHYRHFLDNIPIASDRRNAYTPREGSNPKLSPDYRAFDYEHKAVSTPDEMLVMADDDGVFRIDGAYRAFAPVKQEQINISFDDAVNILADNMDYSKILYIEKESTLNVSQIELCYRLTSLHDFQDTYFNIETETRPAWRFASKTCRDGESNIFYIFIDAVTGEILH